MEDINKTIALLQELGGIKSQLEQSQSASNAMSFTKGKTANELEEEWKTSVYNNEYSADLNAIADNETKKCLQEYKTATSVPALDLQAPYRRGCYDLRNSGMLKFALISMGIALVLAIVPFISFGWGLNFAILALTDLISLIFVVPGVLIFLLIQLLLPTSWSFSEIFDVLMDDVGLLSLTACGVIFFVGIVFVIIAIIHHYKKRKKCESYNNSTYAKLAKEYSDKINEHENNKERNIEQAKRKLDRVLAVCAQSAINIYNTAQEAIVELDKKVKNEKYNFFSIQQYNSEKLLHMAQDIREGKASDYKEALIRYDEYDHRSTMQSIEQSRLLVERLKASEIERQGIISREQEQKRLEAEAQHQRKLESLAKQQADEAKKQSEYLAEQTRIAEELKSKLND